METAGMKGREGEENHKMAKHHHKIYQTRVTKGAKMSWLSNHLLKLYKTVDSLQRVDAVGV